MILFVCATVLADHKSYLVVEPGFAYLQASSIYSPSYALGRVRLNFNQSREGSMAWCPSFPTIHEWLQLSLPRVAVWKSILFQGRGDYADWVKSFTIQYNLDGISWRDYDENRVFKANSDQNTIVTN